MDDMFTVIVFKMKNIFFRILLNSLRDFNEKLPDLIASIINLEVSFMLLFIKTPYFNG